MSITKVGQVHTCVWQYFQARWRWRWYANQTISQFPNVFI